MDLRDLEHVKVSSLLCISIKSYSSFSCPKLIWDNRTRKIFCGQKILRLAAVMFTYIHTPTLHVIIIIHYYYYYYYYYFGALRWPDLLFCIVLVMHVFF